MPTELPTLNAAPEELREALGALFPNALFFNDRAKGERTISIDATTTGADVRVCVRDNGIGIDPRYLSQVFELGLKLDKSRGGGPGYGLYLARRVAESHGGKLTAEAELDQGSTFCLTLPA